MFGGGGDSCGLLTFYSLLWVRGRGWGGAGEGF